MGSRHVFRVGSVAAGLLLAATACSGQATPSSTAATGTPPATATQARTPAPSPSGTPIPTVSLAPTPSPPPTPIPTPPPMTAATIKTGRALAEARSSPATVRLRDGRVLVIGGTVPFVGECPMACINPPTTSVEVYDPRTGRFSRNGSLVDVRTGATALLLNDGRVLVAGGGWEPDPEMEIYDPATGKSRVVPPPLGVASVPGAAAYVLLANGQVLVAGGTYDNGMSTSDKTLIFDPATGAWHHGPRMAGPRQGATATLLDDGRVLVVGGSYTKAYYGYDNGDAELLNPAAAFVAETPLTSTVWLNPVLPETPVRLPGGQVLLAVSGVSGDPSSCSVATPEVFDPATGTFTLTGSMVTPRGGALPVQLADGRVLYLGGTDASCSPLTTVEAFDPATRTFQVVSTAFPKVRSFGATQLDDGRVLIVGGDSGQWNGMTNKTWLLQP
jgi:hypothetical protein